ncbi:GxxExxY protein [Dysgonomonas hofstadii]|nr:GxxExxY protein [Dysgonomonas hofstadii]
MAVVNAGSKVHKACGVGLSHNVYEECIVYELSKIGIKAERQKQVSLKYEKLEFSDAFTVDILVENKLLVGLKPVNVSPEAYSLFVEGYMKHCSSSVGLVLDFYVVNFRSGVKIIEKSAFKPIAHPLIYTEYQYGNKRNKK